MDHDGLSPGEAGALGAIGYLAAHHYQQQRRKTDPSYSIFPDWFTNLADWFWRLLFLAWLGATGGHLIWNAQYEPTWSAAQILLSYVGGILLIVVGLYPTVRTIRRTHVRKADAQPPSTRERIRDLYAERGLTLPPDF